MHLGRKGTLDDTMDDMVHTVPRLDSAAWDALELQGSTREVPHAPDMEKLSCELDSSLWSAEMSSEVHPKELQSGDLNDAASELLTPFTDREFNQSQSPAPPNLDSSITTKAAPAARETLPSPLPSLPAVFSLSSRSPRDPSSQHSTIAIPSEGAFGHSAVPPLRNLELGFRLDPDSASPSQTPSVVVTALSQMQDTIAELQIVNQVRNKISGANAFHQTSVPATMSATYLHGLDVASRVLEASHIPSLEDLIDVIDVAWAIAFDLQSRGRHCSWVHWCEQVKRLRFFCSLSEQDRFLAVFQSWRYLASVGLCFDVNDDNNELHRLPLFGDEISQMPNLKESMIIQLCQHHINGTLAPFDFFW